MAESKFLIKFSNVNRDKYIYRSPVTTKQGCVECKCEYMRDGGKAAPFFFETPRLITATGIYNLDGRFYLDVMVPMSCAFLDWLLAEDEKNIEVTSGNSETWFGEESSVEEISQGYKTSLIFRSKGDEPILRVNIPSSRGKPVLEVFDNNKRSVDISAVVPGVEIACIMEKMPLRFYRDKFTGEYQVYKLKVCSDGQVVKLPPGYIFSQSDEESEEVSQSDEDSDGVSQSDEEREDETEDDILQSDEEDEDPLRVSGDEEEEQEESGEEEEDPLRVSGDEEQEESGEEEEDPLHVSGDEEEEEQEESGEEEEDPLHVSGDEEEQENSGEEEEDPLSVSGDEEEQEDSGDEEEDPLSVSGDEEEEPGLLQRLFGKGKSNKEEDPLHVSGDEESQAGSSDEEQQQSEFGISEGGDDEILVQPIKRTLEPEELTDSDLELEF